eukprot:scaffold10917_cov68-Cyclotella_meneghiniana.AAC.3
MSLDTTIALGVSIRHVLTWPDPHCEGVRCVRKLTIVRHLNHKNYGVTHHSGHYWPYLPNYWELDLPPAPTILPGPNTNIHNTRSVAEAFIFTTGIT